MLSGADSLSALPPSRSAVQPSMDTTLVPSVVIAGKAPLEDAGTLPYRTRLSLKEMEAASIGSAKAFSAIVPGLHIPEYGSSMTSTIYLRGFGSRMENPVMGLYVDDVPLLDKNAYDFDFMDIDEAEVLRGPQGTLYGRNSMMGVMSVKTLSPATWQGYRGGVEYGSGNSIMARAAVYSGAFGISAAYRHRDGFYLNDFTGRLCDPHDGAAFRTRYVKRLSATVLLDDVLSVSWTDEGGYPYRQIVDGELLPVNYNDRAGYRRLHVSDGLRLLVRTDRLEMKSVTSLQLLGDRMDMDQDFTTASMFTLTQAQRQAAVTEEITFAPAQQSERWHRRSGVFAFLKWNRMSAPVTFKQDGIETLILANANAGIPDYLGTLTFDESEFPINSEFGIGSCNLAAYHESLFMLGGWKIAAGLRVDLERDRMDYASDAIVHFILTPTMDASYPCETAFRGSSPNSSFQVLPKISVLRDFTKGDFSASAVATWSEGYRAGGFNTQLFSDILQNLMMNEMMGLCGIHMDNEISVSAENTVYKPEFSDNFELGTHFAWRRGDLRLSGSAAAFCIFARNQQITVFPEGMSTGRMMKNVGRSRSAGVEASASLAWKRFTLDAAYGLTDARFTVYDDGNHDYSGKRIPYSPKSTLSLRAGCRLGDFSILLNVNGVGDIYWNEANTLRQPFYMMYGGKLVYQAGDFRLHLRCENLCPAGKSSVFPRPGAVSPSGSANAHIRPGAISPSGSTNAHIRPGTICTQEIPLFWFKSVGHEFFQMSHPATLTLGVEFSIEKQK